MTATTHQLIALVAAFFVLTLYPLSVGPIVGVLAIMAVMIGALTPDLDQPAANLWQRMLGGNALGNIFQFFSGGHRHFTHSLLGIFAIGWALQWVAHHLVHPAYFGQALVLWYAFMIGYISHSVADTLTDHGVPWLWPLKINFRFPPGPEQLRVTTGSIVESLLVRGGLLIIAALLLSRHGSTFVNLFH